MADEIDREQWTAAWQARMDRRLPEGWRSELIQPLFAEVASVTISAAPSQFAHRVWSQTDLCPVCGESTVAQPRIRAMLDVQYKDGLGSLQGAWAHESCLESCPVIGPAARVPW